MVIPFWKSAPPGYRLRLEIERLKRRRNIFVPGFGEEELPIEPPPDLEAERRGFPFAAQPPPPPPFTPFGIQQFRAGAGPPGAPTTFRMPEPEEVSTPGPFPIPAAKRWWEQPKVQQWIEPAGWAIGMTGPFPGKLPKVRAPGKGAKPAKPATTALPRPAEAVVKKPWEMTVLEYQTYGKPNYGDLVTDGEVAGILRGSDGSRVIIADNLTGQKHFVNFSDVKLIRRMGVGSAIQDVNYDVFHKKIVEQALSEGKPIPPKVLAEYASEPWAQKALAELKAAPKPAEAELVLNPGDTVSVIGRPREGTFTVTEVLPDKIRIISDSGDTFAVNKDTLSKVEARSQTGKTTAQAGKEVDTKRVKEILDAEASVPGRYIGGRDANGAYVTTERGENVPELANLANEGIIDFTTKTTGIVGVERIPQGTIIPGKYARDVNGSPAKTIGDIDIEQSRLAITEAEAIAPRAEGAAARGGIAPTASAGQVGALKREFYIQNQGGQFTQVVGKPVTIPGFEDLDFFLTTVPNTKQWAIVEGRTGLSIAFGKTGKEAMSATTQQIGRLGRQRFMSYLDTYTGNISPRYAESKMAEVAPTAAVTRPETGVPAGQAKAPQVLPEAAPPVAIPPGAAKQPWEPIVTPHPDGGGYAVKVGKNSWISGGAGPFGGGDIGRFSTKEAAWAEAKRLGYIKEIPSKAAAPAVPRAAEAVAPTATLPPIPKTTPTGPYSQEALNAFRQGQIRTAQDMAAQGGTVSDIADELKVTPEYVRGLLAAPGAESAAARVRPETVVPAGQARAPQVLPEAVPPVAKPPAAAAEVAPKVAEAVPPAGAVPPSGVVSPPAVTPPTPSYSELNRIKALTEEQVKKDLPGTIKRFLQRIPGLKQALQAERPGLKMSNEKQSILKAMVGAGQAKSAVATQFSSSQANVIDEIKRTFGNNVLHGGKVDLPYQGDSYILTNAQKAALDNLQAHQDKILSFVNDGYGTEIKAFRPQPTPINPQSPIFGTLKDVADHNGYYLPTVDIGEDVLDVIGGEMKAIVSGRGKERLWQAASERLDHATAKGWKFTPDLDVEKLIRGSDSFLSSAASGEVYRDIVGGLTYEQVLLETHPKLYAQLMAGQNPNLKGINLKPYEFIEAGINKYFKSPEAKLIRDSLKTTNNPVMRVIEGIRGQAFSGDLSPVVGIQTPVGFLFDPLGGLRTAAREIAEMKRTKDILRPFRMQSLLDRVAKDPESWTTFAALNGRQVGSTPHEFRAGFLSKIPGFARFNEATYSFLIHKQYDSWIRNTAILTKQGIPLDVARVAANDIVNKIYPLVSPTRLGQSPARAAMLRMLPTSYSFIRQPISLMEQAANGYAKLIIHKPLTPQEQLATRAMTTLAVSTATTSAISAALSAESRNISIEDAMLKAINPDPKNGDFLTLWFGTRRVPLGGPYRATFRALYPKEVEGLPVPLPFAGLPQYLRNRITPAIKAPTELTLNRDFYGNKIRQGNFLQQMAQSLEYTMEAVMPLTAGEVAEGIRTGLPQEEIIEQAASQFLGSTLYAQSPYAKRDASVRAWTKAEGLDAEKYAELTSQQKRTFDQANPQIGEELKQEIERRAALGGEAAIMSQIKQENIEKLDKNSSYLGEWTGTGWSNAQMPDPANPGKMIPYPVTKWRDYLGDIYTKAATEWATRERLLGPMRERKPKDDKEKALWDYYKIADDYTEKDKEGKPIPGGKILDMEGFIQAQDEYLAGLTPELEKHVLDNLGVNDDERALEFRKDKRIIKEGFWEPMRAFMKPSFENMIENAAIARAQGDVFTAQRLEAMTKGYKDATRGKSQALRIANPEVDMLLAKWGYQKTPHHPLNKAKIMRSSAEKAKELAGAGAR